jgi:gluconokinase
MIVVIAGVSGSGKSTVGALLASRLGWAFADGDSFHPDANVAKMVAGTPLSDEDRRPWLSAIGSWMDERTAAGESGIAACSALKRAYRAELLDGRPARLTFLDVPPELNRIRLGARPGHFFPAQLAETQFAALEVPDPAEDALVLRADGTPEDLVTTIIARLNLGAAR